MSIFSKTKLLAGNWMFSYQDWCGHFRLQGDGRKRLAVLMYHGLESDPRRLAASCHRVTPEGCLKEIHFFQHQGYRLVSAKELEDPGLDRGDGRAGYLLVSFDDGHANIFPYVKKWMEAERIPILLGICPGIVEENGIYWWEEVKARFQLMQQPSVEIRSLSGGVLAFGKSESEHFADCGRSGSHQELQSCMEQLRQQTSYIDRQQLRNSVYVHGNMNWHQIRELAKNPLCSLASHSMYHEIATQVPAEELRRQTQASIKLLEAKTDCPVRHYIYPNGSFSEETDRLLAEQGIVHTYTTHGALNSIPLGTSLHRLNGYDLENRSRWNYGRLWEERHAWPHETRSSGMSGNSVVNATTGRA